MSVKTSTDDPFLSRYIGKVFTVTYEKNWLHMYDLSHWPLESTSHTPAHCTCNYHVSYFIAQVISISYTCKALPQAHT